MSLTFVFPPAIDTKFKKFCFVHFIFDKLIIKFNEWGTKYREGDITLEQWEQFKTLWLQPRKDLLTALILNYRKQAQKHEFGFTLSEVFVEE